MEWAGIGGMGWKEGRMVWHGEYTMGEDTMGGIAATGFGDMTSVAWFS